MLTDKPMADTRSYLAANLTNGVKALSVQDSRAKTVSIAVAVQAGSYANPVEFPGLAHFCEHMLFLGTDKYKDPKQFEDYLSTNGGYSNAYTDNEVTVYYVEVSQAAFETVLDMFAWFFRAPLFNETLVGDEVNAINSEHEKNVQDPAWRSQAVLESLANPDSPVSRFSTGNYDTLITQPKAKGLDVVDALKKYFKTHYCAARLSIVTFSPEPVNDQMQALATTIGQIPTDGSEEVVACNTEKPETYETPKAYGKEQLGKWIDIRGVTHDSSLDVVFYFDSLRKFYREKPAILLSCAMNYGGKDSFMAHLRDDLQWIDGMGEGSSATTSAGSQISISFELTELGLAHAEQIVELVLGFVAALQKDGMTAEAHSKIMASSLQGWNWQEPSSASDVTQGLVEAMTRLPLEDLLSADDTIKRQDMTLINAFIKKFTPENMNVVLTTGVGIESPALDKPKILPFYGVEYAIRALPPSLTVFPKQATKYRWAVPLDILKGVDMSHAVAKKSSNTTLDAELYGQPPQKLDYDWKAGGAPVVAPPQIWERQGWASNAPIGSPRAFITVELRARERLDEPELSPDDQLRLSMYSAMLGERLSMDLYDVESEGATFSASLDDSSMSFSYVGFPGKIPAVIDASKAWGKLRIIENDDKAEKQFERLRNYTRASLQSYSAMPVHYASQAMSRVLVKGSHKREDRLKALERLELQDCLEALDTVRAKPMELTTISMGNLESGLTKYATAAVLAMVHEPQQAAPKVTEDMQVRTVTPILEPAQPVLISDRNPRKNDANEVAIVGILAGVKTMDTWVGLQLVSSLIQEEAFTVLRTKMQLGYVAGGSVSLVSNVMMITFEVQGTAKSADYMEAAIHRVMSQDVVKRLESLSEEEFGMIKKSFEENFKEAPFTTSDEIQHMGQPVLDNTFCFSKRQHFLDIIGKSYTSKDALIELWKKIVLPETGVRKIMTVKYYNSSETDAKLTKATDKATLETFWAEHNLSDEYKQLLSREFDAKMDLFTADAAARKQVLARGGTFLPTTLDCGPRATALIDANRGGGDVASQLETVGGEPTKQDTQPSGAVQLGSGSAAFLQAKSREAAGRPLQSIQRVSMIRPHDHAAASAQA